jgi:hypothetical protein
MRAITASTLLADVPAVMADLLILLQAVPAGSPSSPLSGPEKPQALGRVA